MLHSRAYGIHEALLFKIVQAQPVPFAINIPLIVTVNNKVVGSAIQWIETQNVRQMNILVTSFQVTQS
ncbi:MAG: hypothetical protein KDB96_11685 [Flavobacteriales bacterium]|nr:hypothetical protein [Flavobacteriales bacterium]